MTVLPIPGTQLERKKQAWARLSFLSFPCSRHIFPIYAFKFESCNPCRDSPTGPHSGSHLLRQPVIILFAWLWPGYDLVCPLTTSPTRSPIHRIKESSTSRSISGMSSSPSSLPNPALSAELITTNTRQGPWIRASSSTKFRIGDVHAERNPTATQTRFTQTPKRDKSTKYDGVCIRISSLN